MTITQQFSVVPEDVAADEPEVTYESKKDSGQEDGIDERQSIPGEVPKEEELKPSQGIDDDLRKPEIKEPKTVEGVTSKEGYTQTEDKSSGASTKKQPQSSKETVRSLPQALPKFACILNTL